MRLEGYQPKPSPSGRWSRISAAHIFFFESPTIVGMIIEKKGDVAVRLLKNGKFQHDKVNYEFQLETDGHKLFFALTANKRKKRTFPPELRNKLNSLLSSNVVDNLIQHPEFITFRSRNEYGISYPDDSKVLEWHRQLDENGYIPIESDEYEIFKDYLEYKDINVIETKYMGKQYIFASLEHSKSFIEKLYDEIKIKEQEIRSMKDAIHDLVYAESRLGGA